MTNITKKKSSEGTSSELGRTPYKHTKKEKKATENKQTEGGVEKTPFDFLTPKATPFHLRTSPPSS